MKRICAIVFTLMLLLAACPAAVAQQFIPAPVEISSKTATVDGKLYYEHTVEGRQTLYSICKAYGADLDEVTAINSDKLAQGLKAGCVLLIPHGGVSEVSGSDIDSVDEESVQQTEESGKYLLHRVKWYDSMLMLALKYKVTQEQIMTLNGMTSKTLVVGQYIKIPVSGADVTAPDNTILDDTEDDSATSGDDAEDASLVTGEDLSDESPKEDVLPFIPFSGTARIALLLPIGASNGEASDNFLDFYSGILMALDQVKSSGINVNLKVIDIAAYDSFEDITDTAALDHYDFAIGHFPAEWIDAAADYFDNCRIPLISPMDQKLEQAAYRHPYLINIPLSSATQAMRLAESIGFDPFEDNVIVLCENGEDTGQFHADVLASLDNLQIPYSIARSGIGREGSAHVGSLLKNNKHNHIIITSEKESLASDAVRNTGLLGRDDTYRVTGYASQKVRRFDSIDPESFQGMNAHFCLGYYVDYQDENVRSFVRSYRALYNAEPGPYAFQGFDIVLYAVNALEKFGSDMINGIAGYPEHGLQLNFRFDRRSDLSGMFNEATRNLIYRDGDVILCN